MAMVDSDNTNSSHSRVQEEACSRLRPQAQQQQPSELGDDALAVDTEDKKDSRFSSPPPEISTTTQNDIDMDDDESSEQSRSDYLLDSLLNPSSSPNDSHKHHSNLTINGLTLSSPVINQRGSCTSLDCSNQYSDEWNTNSSLHSESEAAADKTWTTMDSIHSRASTSERGSATGANLMEVNGNLMDRVGNNSMDFNDSCCSFASFGNLSDSSLNDSGNDLSLQRAAFTRLSEEPTPRRVLMDKTQSLRMMRARSYRGSSLTLIDESNSLD